MIINIIDRRGFKEFQNKCILYEERIIIRM